MSLFKDNIAKYALFLAFFLLSMNLQNEYGEAARIIPHFSAIPESMATMSSSRMRKIVLNSSDGETFEVEEAVAMKSQTIKHMIEEDCAGNNILLPNVTGKILGKVIEYCKHHVEAAGKICDKTSKDDLKKFDAEFVKVDQSTLFHLVLAANYLEINSLLDLTSKTVADMVYGKTPDEIRKMFNIKNGFEPEEEKEAMREIGHLNE